MAGNKIDIREIGSYEITIAKCGWLELIMIANPQAGNKYKIRSNGETIIETNYLWEAIANYNELVQ